jgi:ectoine hydroxylase-related dioxygenase (phytanoyl-CoA dioxygenase family)
MTNIISKNYKKELETNGFTILESIYSLAEIENICNEIEKISDSTNLTFRKTKDLFAIRQFLKEVPSVEKLIFKNVLKEILESIFGKEYFVVKSIYFDKPEESNWFVGYHQDLTISVDKKLELKDFSNWNLKQNQYSVQPSDEVLKNICTVRIHLDDTNEENGALKVIPNSHHEVIRLDTFDFKNKKETFCNVPKGGIMIMKPLLFHASNKTTNKEKRRVIHLEFSNKNLPNELSWSEKLSIN